MLAEAFFILMGAVRLEGQFVSPPSLLLSTMGLEGSATPSFVELRSTLKEAIQRGILEDVAVFREGDSWILRVVEAPRLRSATFVFEDRPEAAHIGALFVKGDQPFTRKDLRDTLKLYAGMRVPSWRVALLRDSLRRLYRSKGYVGVRVAVAVDTPATGEVSLRFRIHKGDRPYITRVTFHGNRAFPASRLLKVMQNKPRNWLRWGYFNEEKWAEDPERIEAFYHNHGYPQARVESTRVVRENGTVALELFIHEGKRYVFGPYTVEGDFEIPEGVLRRLVRFREGEPFSTEKLRNTLMDLQGLMADSGYLYAQVLPVENVVDDSVIVLQIRLRKGVRVRVRRIDILGNTKTFDRVIRRELLIYPGEYFSRTRLIRSLRNLYFTNFFQNVNPTFQPAEDSTWVDLAIQVEEKPTGQIGAGASYSPVYGASVYLQVQEPNFLGRGQTVSAQVNYGGQYKTFQFSFLDPWWRGNPESIGGSLYYLQNFYTLDYRDERVGGSVTKGWRALRSFWSISLKYSLERVHLLYIIPEFQNLPGVQDLLARPRLSSAFSFTFTWDSRNRRFNAFRGTRISTTTTLTGWVLQGDLHYYKEEAEAGTYVPLWQIDRTNNAYLLLAILGRGGYAWGLDKAEDLPFYERFFLGDVSTFYALRGYSYRAVGRDINGGRMFLVLTAELRLRLNEQFYALTFLEGGNTWLSFQDFADAARSENTLLLRRSVGIGARFEMPMLGVIGLDLAWPLTPLPGQGRRMMTHFVFGFTRF